MSPSRWANYLESFASTLERARGELDRPGSAAYLAAATLERPEGPIPEQLRERAHELLVECAELMGDGERCLDGLAARRRLLEARGRVGVRTYLLDEAL